MSEPNPYADGEYKWGPGQQGGASGGTPAYGYPQDAPGYGYPQAGSTPAAGVPYQPTLPGGVPIPPPHAPAGSGAPLLSLGDITVVGDQIITPAGSMPLKGAVWNAMDMSRTEEKLPTVAIVLAIVFFTADEGEDHDRLHPGHGDQRWPAPRDDDPGDRPGHHPLGHGSAQLRPLAERLTDCRGAGRRSEPRVGASAGVSGRHFGASVGVSRSALRGDP